jgi:transcriptional regulator with XRE-family HTH domain
MVQGSLAHKLRVLRAERGLTLREAASLTGVAKETISDIERGLRHPHDPTLAKIAKGYGVPVGDLLEEPVPLAEASEETGRLEEERLEADSPKDRQQWERVLASVRERQREVEAKVGELVALPDHSEADLYRAKWALDEAQDCEVSLLLAQPGSRREQDKIMLEIDPLTVDVDQFEEWQQEWGIAKRFYDGIFESLVEAGLVELKEPKGQKAEPVPVGI